METDPPLHDTYKTLLDKTIKASKSKAAANENKLVIIEECELPLVDLGRLSLSELEKEKCKAEIARASQEWGFFQVVNHGISCEILEKMRCEQVKVFKQSFHKKSKENKDLNFPTGTYRWGSPTATCLSHLSWSEAFHIPMNDISASIGFSSLR